MIRNINLKVDWLLYFIVLLPTFYIAGGENRYDQIQFFQISAMLLVAVMHVNKWLGAFLGWCVFQFLFFKNMPNYSVTLQNIFLAAVIYQFIVKCCYIKSYKKYLWAFTGLLALNVAWCFFQMFQLDPIFQMYDSKYQQTFTEYAGFFALPAFLGNFTAPLVTLSFLLSYYLTPLFLIALFFSKSTFSMLAAFSAILFFFWFRKRIAFWIILLIGGVAFLTYAIKYDLPTGQFERRINVWGVVLKLAFKNQFLGYGIGTYGNQFIAEATPSHNIVFTNDTNYFRRFLQDEAAALNKLEVFEYIKSMPPAFNLFQLREKMRANGMDFEMWKNAHNEFLEIFYETGLIGLFIVCGFIFDFFKRFWRYARDNTLCVSLMASFVAILIVSFGHFPFHLARLAGSFIVLMAMLDLALIEARKTKEEGW